MSAARLPLGLLPVVLWCAFILEHSCPYRTHSPCHGSGSGCRTMGPLLTSDLSPSPASGVEPQLGRARSVQVQSVKKGSWKSGEERGEVLMECLRNCQCWDWNKCQHWQKWSKVTVKTFILSQNLSLFILISILELLVSLNSFTCLWTIFKQWMVT